MTIIVSAGADGKRVHDLSNLRELDEASIANAERGAASNPSLLDA